MIEMTKPAFPIHCVGSPGFPSAACLPDDSVRVVGVVFVFPVTSGRSDVCGPCAWVAFITFGRR